jgi:hypothetical protein
MTSASETLDEMISALRELGEGRIGEAIAKRAAPALEESIKKTARAGQDPEGKPWAPRKDGGPALQHAADHIRATAHGDVVRVTLTGPDVFHHFGATRGGVRRQVIPDAGAELPPSVVKALTEAARAELEARLAS